MRLTPGSSFHLEPCEVDLGLLAGRRLEANFKGARSVRSQLAQHVRDRCVAALISKFAKQSAPVKAGNEAIRSCR